MNTLEKTESLAFNNVSEDQGSPSEKEDIFPQIQRARPIPRISIQAFCEAQSTADTLQNTAEDRRLAKAHMHVQMGGLEAALAFYKGATTPNLIVLETHKKEDELLENLDMLADVCDSGTKVLIIGPTNDIILYRELLRRGVSEYLVLPLKPIDIMESISNLYNDPETDPVGSVIAFIGAKGGVGSSTVCHNTAWLISEAIKTDVVIADMDLPFGTAGLDFNQDPVQGILDALSAPERLDEMLLDRLLSKCSEHLSLFSAPATLEQEYDIDAEACETVIDITRSNIPYVLVDLPHTWTSWTKKILMQADEIVITAIPDLANLRNTKNLIDVLKNGRDNDRDPWLVFNQVNMPKRPEISVKDISKAIGIDSAITIDFDSELFGMATNNGQMIEEISKKSKASESFRELAFLLTHRTDNETENSKSLLAPFLKRFGVL
ncbi:MAG: AAA family ATPase [Pseudomonadota bacterium]